MFLLPFQQKSGIFRKRKTIQRGRRSERRKRKREIEKEREREREGERDREMEESHRTERCCVRIRWAHSRSSDSSLCSEKTCHNNYVYT